MKNLITITSILAAGTLCANAAVNLGADLVTDDSMTARAISQISSIFSTDVGDSVSGMAIYNNGFLLTDGTLYGCAANAATTNTSNFVSISSTSGDILLGNQNGGSSSGYAGTVAYVQNALTADAISVASDLSLTFSVSGLSEGTGSSGQALSVAILYGTGSGSNSTWTVVGREYATTTNGTHTIALSDSVNYSSDGKFLIVLGTGTTPTGADHTWTQVGDDGVTISGLSIIPEPSLFGLFAGTLALGLAGTRRRRR